MNILEHAVSLGIDPRTVRNWAPIANDLIAKDQSVEFPAGIFHLGDSTPPPANDPFPDPNSRGAIIWGWNRTKNVSISGAGIGQTVLRIADNVILPQNFSPLSNFWSMIFTGGQGPADSVDCANSRVIGITFDGNHRNNPSFTNKAIRIVGSNTVIESCEFLDFATGTPPGGPAIAPECFVVECFLATSSAPESKGATIRNCTFRMPGRKWNSNPGYTTENTQVDVGGNMLRGISASGVVVEGCRFSGDFNRTNQQSPLHGITLFNTIGAVIRDNVFVDFQGSCIYADSGPQIGTKITGNTATNVWTFVQLSVQNWVRMGSGPWQIARFKDMVISGNNVSLSSGSAPYAWDAPDQPSAFLGYLWDRDVDPTRPSFENVVVAGDNIVKSPSNAYIVMNYGGYSPREGRWMPGDVLGGTDGIRLETSSANAGAGTTFAEDRAADRQRATSPVVPTIVPQTAKVVHPLPPTVPPASFGPTVQESSVVSSDMVQAPTTRISAPNDGTPIAVIASLAVLWAISSR